jgi:beta-lactamase class A
MKRIYRMSVMIIMLVPIFAYLGILRDNYLGVALADDSANTVVSPIPDDGIVLVIQATPTPNHPMTMLEPLIEHELDGTNGTWSILAKNLTTGETYTYNEKERYDAASLYKLWVMGTVYDKVRSGEISETDVLSRDIATLNKRFNISQDDAEIKEGSIRLSVGNALNRMITVSDNYSALLLAEKIRLSNVSKYLVSLDLSESRVGTAGGVPRSTVGDTAKFLEKLYNGELAESSLSAKMMELLKGQTINHKIPKYLPRETVIAHKTGELNGFSHDAAIVFTESDDYLLVIMTESPTPSVTEEKIAKVSKVVYDFMVASGR